ncbi:MAG TPA: phage tail tape measure protein, partial [Maribacter sp.]|nr:phage tail tape measure protein [Maribacter sp.]
LTFKRFAAAGIVTGTVFRLTQAISEGVSKALEFERGLVKLSQITGRTTGNLNSLKKAVNDLATGLGKDANELLEISQIFAQTQQSINQIKSSITAVARSSLAPTFGEMKQTAEGLVAALNQFGISASQSEAILGSLNRVSKKFAVESDDLIAAIRRAGGVFAIAAGQFAEPQEALNQFLGIFTAVRSTTRETAETIATGLRTIFSRIQRPQTIDFLQELGINLKDAQGNFVGLFESFRILSKELDTVIASGDALALAKITEELGGIRQVGKLIPAIREFRKAEQAFLEAQ